MEFISIGPYCDAAGILKKHNLRLSSYPFDYIFSSLELIKHAIGDKFHIFLDEQYYRPGTVSTSTRHSFYCTYLDTDILYTHHRMSGYPVHYKVSCGNLFNHHNMFDDKNHDAFKRRCDRLLQLLASDTKIVFVYYNKYTTAYDDLIEFNKYFLSNPNVYTVGIFDNNKRKQILYESPTCKIYQNYDHTYIFNDVRTTFGDSPSIELV
jgi:hypothetical protein